MRLLAWRRSFEERGCENDLTTDNRSQLHLRKGVGSSCRQTTCELRVRSEADGKAEARVPWLGNRGGGCGTTAVSGGAGTTGRIAHPGFRCLVVRTAIAAHSQRRGCCILRRLGCATGPVHWICWRFLCVSDGYAQGSGRH